MTTNDIDAIRNRAYVCMAYRHRWANELGVNDQDVLDDLRRAKELVVDNVPALCDEVEQLRAKLAKARQERDEYADDNTRVAVALVDVQRKLTAANQNIRDRYEHIAKLELHIADLEQQCNEQMHQLAERARTQETTR